jgi:hypothetical protein
MKFLLLLAFGLTATPALAAPSCRGAELRLAWPIGGAYGADWVINNYLDLDDGVGLKDWMGNTGAQAKTYNGHHGIDIDLRDFRAMDLGVAATSAAPGVVTEVEDDLFDHNFEGAPGCGPWNHVYIKHDNGYVSWYGHLKFKSVAVKVGDRVRAQQFLGLVGSAGCSSTAHLHFELHDCDDKVVDPSLENMFQDPQPYSPSLRLMDLIVRRGPFPTLTPADALLKDPQPNALGIPAGGRIGVGLSTAGGVKGDRIDVQIVRPGGGVFHTFSTLTLDNDGRHMWPRWWVALPADAKVEGGWKVEVRFNSQLVKTHDFSIQPTSEDIFFGQHDMGYPAQFNSLVTDGYRPIRVDGSPSPEGGARISGIFRRGGSSPFRADHNLTSADYQAIFNQELAAHHQLISIDNYLVNGEPRIASVFGKQVNNDWQAYHLVSVNDHQAKFNQLTGQGFRPYVISVTAKDGRAYISAAYNKEPSRGWVAKFGLDSAGYQREIDAQKAKGFAPEYIDAYEDGGIPKFSVIWTVEANSVAWEARHNLDQDQMFRFAAEQTRLRHFAKSITSYLSGGKRLYAGVWSASP